MDLKINEFVENPPFCFEYSYSKEEVDLWKKKNRRVKDNIKYHDFIGMLIPILNQALYKDLEFSWKGRVEFNKVKLKVEHSVNPGSHLQLEVNGWKIVVVVNDINISSFLFVVWEWFMRVGKSHPYFKTYNIEGFRNEEHRKVFSLILQSHYMRNRYISSIVYLNPKVKFIVYTGKKHKIFIYIYRTEEFLEIDTENKLFLEIWKVAEEIYLKELDYV